MKIDRPQFARFAISPDRVLFFPGGLPGFEGLHRFSVFPSPVGKPGHYVLQSLDDAEVAFDIADPAIFGVDYELVLSDEEVQRIALESPGDAVLAVILLRPAVGESRLRAHFAAPLVINVRNRSVLQHVLRADEEGVRLRRSVIATEQAPAAIGTYSQAVQAGNTIYLSGQIGLDPVTMQLVEGIEAQVVRVFDNLKAVAVAAGAGLDDVVKINVYLTDLANFAKVNEVMARYFGQPYPARAAVGVKELPRGALVEADAILVVG